MKPQLAKGEVGKYLNHALAGFDLPSIDTSDIEQVKERCEWYFQRCIDDDVRPTVAGLSNALGLPDRPSTGGVSERGGAKPTRHLHSALETSWKR